MIQYKFSLPAPGTFQPGPREQVYLDWITKHQLTKHILCRFE